MKSDLPDQERFETTGVWIEKQEALLRYIGQLTPYE